MLRPIAQIKEQLREHLLAACLPSSINAEPIALCGKDGPAEFSVKCLFRSVKTRNTAGLLARINYHFPNKVSASVSETFRHVEKLNYLLVHSKVFVVQDIDGDHSYYLRMDTLLEGRYEKENISAFLEGMSQDMDILVGYFRYKVSDAQPAYSSAAVANSFV